MELGWRDLFIVPRAISTRIKNQMGFFTSLQNARSQNVFQLSDISRLNPIVSIIFCYVLLVSFTELSLNFFFFSFILVSSVQ